MPSLAVTRAALADDAGVASGLTLRPSCWPLPPGSEQRRPHRPCPQRAL